jgi:hypothetical protein
MANSYGGGYGDRYPYSLLAIRYSRSRLFALIETGPVSS